MASVDEGTARTTGSSFLARAEAHQRRWRRDMGIGWEEFGHAIDADGVERSANLLHSAARSVLADLDTAGKADGRRSVLGNTLSSEAMRLNIFAPLATERGGLALAAQALAPFVKGLASVSAIHLDRSPEGASGCDVVVEFGCDDGSRGVLVIISKFVEETFATSAHAFAKSEATRLGVGRYVFALCGPAGNEVLLNGSASVRGAPSSELLVRGGEILERFRRTVEDPNTVVFMALERLLPNLERLARGGAPELSGWATSLRERYLIPSIRQGAAAQGRTPLKKGHRRVLDWMMEPMFRRIVEIHDEAAQGRGRVYYRLTDTGVVMTALSDIAPKFLGLGKNSKDYKLPVDSAAPTEGEAAARWSAFEKRAATVKRDYPEDKGTIRWIRSALDANLALPELGPGWIFLHHEWRFLDDQGEGHKADLLAVDVPSGKLAIIELKESEEQLGEAREQVRAYGDYWERDARWLAPFFSDLLQIMADLYGHEEAKSMKLATEPAKLYIGIATPEGVSVKEVE